MDLASYESLSEHLQKLRSPPKLESSGMWKFRFSACGRQKFDKRSGKWTVELVELADALYNYYNQFSNDFKFRGRRRFKFVIELFMWDFKFLSSFLRLKSYYGDYGLLHFTHNLLQAWNSTDPFKEAWSNPFFGYGDEGEAWNSTDPFEEAWNSTDPVPKVLEMKQKLRAEYSFPQIPTLIPPTNIIPSPNFVLDFIDTVVDNLHLLVVTNDPSSWFFIGGPKDQIEEALKELNLLRFFVLFVSKKCTQPETHRIFFAHVLIEASHIAMVVLLYAPFQHNQSRRRVLALTEMNALLSDFHKIRKIRKIYIDVLRDLKSTIQPGLHPFIVQNKDATAEGGFVETPPYDLVEMRNLLRASLIHPPILDLKFYLQDIDIVIIDAGLLIYSLHDMKEGTMLEDVNRAVGLHLPSNIQPIMEMIYLIIRRAFQSNLPRIYGLGSVDVLLNNLKELQGRYADSLVFAMNQLQIIQNLLESTQPSFQDVAEEHAILLSGKAYEVEFVIYSCVRKEVPQWCLERWLRNIIEEIILSKTKEEILRKNMLPHEPRDLSTAQIPSTLPTNPRMAKEFVGFEEVRKELREKLLRGCRHLDVLSIVGMPGLGKTTLANKLYSDESIISHFDIRAQCCVSQVYNRKELLLAILHDATGESPDYSIDEADVAERLRRNLLTKRYLILVDDVWETNAWDELRPCFYDAVNGSRVILTTRHLRVANYATSISEPIPLRMFNDNESWELLKEKVFGNESGCSPQLEEAGQQIAKKCGGLPLSIVLVAGILAKMEKKQKCWKEVATTLSSKIHNDSKAIVEQSYQDLPYHLKPCFLYLGAFLEDRVIDASMITRLWISESFIKSCEGLSLEVIAQGYLEDLIARNLVILFKRNYLDGKVEAFRIHDLLLEFCKKRVAEENFLLWIKWDQGAAPLYFYSHKQNAQPRLAFCDLDNLVEWSSSYSLVRSVIFWCTKFQGSKVKTFGIFHHFMFVNVLHLGQDVVIDDFPTNLVHLKYFSARTTQRSIPSSVSNLWNLETLVLENYYRSIMFVPDTIWKLVKLRNLHLSDGFYFPNPEGLFEDSSKLPELRTLSTPLFNCLADVNLIFREVPKLRELICKFRDDRGADLYVLDIPTQLDKLRISKEYDHQTFSIFISPSNLKELTILGFKMSFQHLSNIGQLQRLQSLHLSSIKFDDEKWEVSDEEFPQLKVLKLDECSSLSEWIVADDAFPNLECLILDGCWTLKEIPSCFREISSLKSIEVSRCMKSVVKSAKDIRETQVEDYQNTAFKLIC